MIKLDKIITQEQIAIALDTCYKSALNGIPGSKSCYELANEYLSKYSDKDSAAMALIKNQKTKCGTAGFLLGLGGVIVLPVSIPADIASVFYIQLRMIATISIIYGYEPSNDEVQTLAYVCLTGSSISKICKDTSIIIGEKIAISAIKQMPKTILTKINQAVGFRLATKFGEKSIISLGKMVPVVGGAIGGLFDYTSTNVISKAALKTFKEENLD